MYLGPEDTGPEDTDLEDTAIVAAGLVEEHPGARGD